MRRKGRGTRSTDPPQPAQFTNTVKQPRPSAYQFTPDGYMSNDKPLSTQQIAAEARKVGEIGVAQGIGYSDARHHYLSAKTRFEAKKPEAAKAQHSPAQQQALPTAKAQAPIQAQAQQHTAPSPRFTQFIQDQTQSFAKGCKQLSQKAQDFFKQNSRDSPKPQSPQNKDRSKDQIKDKPQEKSKDCKER